MFIEVQFLHHFGLIGSLATNLRIETDSHTLIYTNIIKTTIFYFQLDIIQNRLTIMFII